MAKLHIARVEGEGLTKIQAEPDIKGSKRETRKIEIDPQAYAIVKEDLMVSGFFDLAKRLAAMNGEAIGKDEIEARKKAMVDRLTLDQIVNKYWEGVKAGDRILSNARLLMFYLMEEL